MTMLIADAGSTKTDWRLVGVGEGRSFATGGLNPHHLCEAALRRELRLAAEAVGGVPVGAIRFYGSGCTPDKAPLMAGLLTEVFGIENVEVQSDMVGAARAVAGDAEALVGILGTGSNLCYWDGHSTHPSVASLGYLLGDEGSGAYIGKQLLRMALRDELPPALQADFAAQTGLTQSEALHHAYEERGAGAWLASLVPFCVRHRQHSTIQHLLQQSFAAFLSAHCRMIQPHAQLPIHFVGSIAWQFADELRAQLRGRQLCAGRFLKAPIEGLEAYYAGED